MATADEIRVQALGFSVDETPSGGAAGAIDAWRTGGGAAGRNALNTPAQGGTIDPVPNRAINTLYTSVNDVKATTDGFDDRFTDVIGEETGADQVAFDAFGKNLIQVITDLKSDEPPDDDLLYARSRATGATAGTWEEITAGGAAMPEPPDDDLLYARSRATGATAGTWEEIISGGAMPEPPDDDLIYGRSRATGATGGTWEEIRGGGIAVGPTAPSPASQDDIWLSTAGLGLWSYVTGPGWLQRISSGTQGATGATGPTGAAQGITIGSATNPATASPGDLWSTPSGGLYIYTVVPGGWWPII